MIRDVPLLPLRSNRFENGPSYGSEPDGKGHRPGITSLVPSRNPISCSFRRKTGSWTSDQEGTARVIDLRPTVGSQYDANVDFQSLLLTARARSPSDYDEAIGFVNPAFGNQRKGLAGCGPARLVVRGKSAHGTGYEHPIGGLSSGERQMVPIIGFIAATLRPGGIVMLDDPDLHIHMGMVRQLMDSIDAIVNARDGQVIVASHSEHVCDWFSRDSEKIADFVLGVEGSHDDTTEGYSSRSRAARGAADYKERPPW